MKQQQLQKNDVYRRALRLALPMMLQNGITNAVGLVDNIMVGRLGTEAITAVSISGQLMFVFSLAIFGGIAGPGIYSAQYYGHGNLEGVRNSFRMKLWIALICVIVGLLVFLNFHDNLFLLYLQSEDGSLDPVLTMQLAWEYLAVMLFSMVPFALTQVYAGSLRETGESVKPMVAGIVSVVVDIVLNYILIFGHFGFPKMGVAGAALATVFARVAECGVVMVWAHLQSRKHTFLQGIYRTLLIPGWQLAAFLKKGFPIFLNEFLWSGSIAALTQCYSIRGLDVVPGLNISNAICNLMNVVFIAMGNAVGILVGQALGAGEYERAKHDAKKLTYFTGLCCLVLTFVLIGLSRVFPLAYETSDQVRSYATNFIVITAIFFPVQGVLNSLYFTLRSGGKTIITFLFDSVFSWCISLPLALMLCHFTTLSVFGIYVVVQATDILKTIIGAVLVKKGVWINNMAEEGAAQ